jgi:hypothetical protein
MSHVSECCLPLLSLSLSSSLTLSGGSDVRDEGDEFAALLNAFALPRSLDDLLSPLDGAEPTSGLSKLVAEWLEDFFSFNAAALRRDGEAEADDERKTQFPLPSESLLAPALPFELDRCVR